MLLIKKSKNNPNKDTIKALDEQKEMQNNKVDYIRYSSFEDVLKEIEK